MYRFRFVEGQTIFDQALVGATCAIFRQVNLGTGPSPHVTYDYLFDFDADR